MGNDDCQLTGIFYHGMALSGTVLSPEKFLPPAYLTLFFPVIVALNIGFVFFWLLARKWFFLISLSLLLFSSSQINDTIPFHFGQIESVQTDKTIHILSYN